MSTESSSQIQASQATQQQVQQIRATILQQVANLKQQLQVIQQQQLQSMLNLVDNVVATQLTDSIQQILTQAQPPVPAPPSPVPVPVPQTPVAPLPPAGNAINAASSAVNNAMAAAEQGVKQAEAGFDPNASAAPAAPNTGNTYLQ